MKSNFFLFTFLICLTVSLKAQDTIHIPADYPTIQEGIDAADNHGVVLVDQGIYYENIINDWKKITITSNYIITLDSSDIYNTIIDGSQPVNPDEASTVTLVGPDTNTIICGFTIRNGSGTLITNRYGGGIFCTFNGKIIHNRIIDNALYSEAYSLGSGIYAEGSGTSNSTFVIRHNYIANNDAENSNSSFGCFGGGIRIYNGQAIIENNIIRENIATGRTYGVGICCEESNGTMCNNLITENEGFHNLASGGSQGGGIYVVNHHAPLIIIKNEITNNKLNHISGNTEKGGGISVYNIGGYENNSILIDKNIISGNFAAYGGGVSVAEIYNIELSNNAVIDNIAEYNGGGIYFRNVSDKNNNNVAEDHIGSKWIGSKKAGYIPVMANNTIAGNNAGTNGGGLAIDMDMEHLMFNNIIYGNLADSEDNEIYQTSSENLYLFNNNINTNEITGNGNWVEEDNIDVDPLFDVDGYHLLGGSGCINAGTEFVEFNDSTYYAPDYDIDFEIRPLNSYIDIGADELSLTDIAKNPNHFNNSKLLIYPNPVNSAIQIEYEIQESSYVQLSIYNQFGKKVKSLISEYQTKGIHEININLSDLKPAIYFCLLKTNPPAGGQTKKIIKL